MSVQVSRRAPGPEMRPLMIQSIDPSAYAIVLPSNATPGAEHMVRMDGRTFIKVPAVAEPGGGVRLLVGKGVEVVV